MQHYTTNQVKQFAANNQYVQMYLQTGCHYQHRYISKIGRNPAINSRYSLDFNTNFRNQLYAQAWDEVLNKFPKLDEQVFFSVNLDGYPYKFGGRYNCTISGKVRVEISNCGNDNGYFNKLPFIDAYSHTFVYSGVIDKQHIQAAAKVEIEKYLYAAGIFRQIQLLNNCTKERAKHFYRATMEHIKNAPAYEAGATLKVIKKRLNLYSDILDDDKFINAAKKIGRRDTPTKVEGYDYSWFNDFDGDCDELETEYYNTLEENTIYI